MNLLLNRSKGRAELVSTSPLEVELAKIKEALAVCKYPDDMLWLEKLHAYLLFAKECGLDGEHIVRSCLDLALTTTQIDALESQAKEAAWQRSAVQE